MNDIAAHPRGWQISEIVFGVPLLAGIALDFFRPLVIAVGWLATLLLVLGVLLAILGIGCVYYARQELALYHQPVDPGKPTTTIVTTGIYSFSRNPLYLGAALLVLGLGLALNSWWILISLIPALVLCHVILIFPEERYLKARLDEEYQVYLRSVNRWLGRKQFKQ